MTQKPSIAFDILKQEAGKLSAQEKCSVEEKRLVGICHGLLLGFCIPVPSFKDSDPADVELGGKLSDVLHAMSGLLDQTQRIGSLIYKTASAQKTKARKTKAKI